MFSSVKKKHLNAKSYLEDFSLEKESSKIQRLADTYGKLKRTNSISKEKRTSLVTEVKKEKSRPSRQKKMMGEIIRMIQLPENDLGRPAECQNHGQNQNVLSKVIVEWSLIIT